MRTEASYCCCDESYIGIQYISLRLLLSFDYGEYLGISFTFLSSVNGERCAIFSTGGIIGYLFAGGLSVHVLSH